MADGDVGWVNKDAFPTYIEATYMFDDSFFSLIIVFFVSF